MSALTRVATVAERLRRNLFVIPGLCLLVGAVLAEVIVRLDRAGAGSWLPSTYETSPDDARAVLSAIATGTITVVTLVLTLTLVAIQLASGQLSPRTIVNFLGDRFQQATVGVVLGTATLSLFGLRSLRVASEAEIQPPDLTVLAAVTATVISLIMLVISVDRTASRLAVGQLVRDIAQETCDLAARRYGGTTDRVAAEQPGRLHGSVPADDTTTDARCQVDIAADVSGWVQYIDEAALIAAVPDDAEIELLRPVGTFVLAGMRFVTVRSKQDLDDEARGHLAGALVVGDSRTTQQDIGFGFTRMTDIGLRALSPGINDPNTAREVILRTAQVVLTLQEYQLDAPVVEFDGRRIVRRQAPTHDDFARAAFDQLRRGAKDDVAVLQTMAAVLHTIVAETERRDLPGATDELHRQRDLVEKRLEELGESVILDELDGERGASLP